MYLKTPTMNDRPMKKLKEYKHHILFVDEKTGIRECFQYWDLNHEIVNYQVHAYDDSGDLIPTNKKQTPIKNNIKNDNRLSKIIERTNFYEELVKKLI